MSEEEKIALVDHGDVCGVHRRHRFVRAFHGERLEHCIRCGIQNPWLKNLMRNHS